MKLAILGVSGSVAAYRAADLARDLMRAGFTVRACLTDGAEKFVTSSLFEALTGQPSVRDTFEEPERGRMAHIDWARQASVLVIAPATANTLNRIAFGLADDMLTTLALAYTGPIVVAPAMNPSMYANESTQEGLRRLSERGVTIVEPSEGDVACGENGQGKLAPNARILEAVLEASSFGQQLKGKKVVITSGPTREPIDEVRFLSNRSSGRMGAALARAALALGAEVVVVSGPVTVTYPPLARVVPVGTAEEMLRATLHEAGSADWVVGCAAVADYRPNQVFKGKLRRADGPPPIQLVENPDIIAEVAKVAKGAVVGFAAEPTSDASVAAEKLERKGLFAIAANDVSGTGVGFEAEDNALTLIFSGGRRVESGRRSKSACARWFWEELLSG